jgi:hypothetical protein
MSFDHPTIVELLATQWAEPDDGSACWATYGITEAARDTIVRLQGGRCAICHEEDRLVVDHCHATGRVRGLICHTCNVAIGRAGDDSRQLRKKASRLERAAAYLEHATRGAESERVASWRTRVEAKNAVANAERLARCEARSSKEMARADAEAAREADAERERMESVARAEVARSGRYRSVDILGMWPKDLIVRFPVGTVSPPTHRSAFSRWSIWVPSTHAGRVAQIIDGLWESEQDAFVNLRGVVYTGNALAYANLSPEETVAYFVAAFRKSFTSEIAGYPRRDVDDAGILGPVDAATCALVPWGKKVHPWHDKCSVVVPEVPVALNTFDEDINSAEDLVQAAADLWRITLERWSLFSVIDPRAAEVAA